MRFLSRHAIFFGALISCFFVSGCAFRQHPTAFTPNPEQVRMASLMTERLNLSCDVAWYKYVNSLPVRDAKRERELLATLVTKSSRYGLDSKKAQLFFSGQIHASCTLQQRLIHQWKRGARLPVIPYMSLQKEIRPKLDGVSEKMLASLSVLQKQNMTPSEAAIFANYVKTTLEKNEFPWWVAHCAASPLKSALYPAKP